MTYLSNSAKKGIILGIQDGHAHITGDFTTGLFRASTRGAAPRNSWCIDGIYDLIAYVSIWICFRVSGGIINWDGHVLVRGSDLASICRQNSHRARGRTSKPSQKAEFFLIINVICWFWYRFRNAWILNPGLRSDLLNICILTHPRRGIPLTLLIVYLTGYIFW